MIMKLICGFFMALADSVPGVSGGTIAFLLGQYDDFINSLHYFVIGTIKQRIKAIKFLLQLGIGWIVGFVLAVLILTAVFQSHIYQISSLFLGFIVFSIPIVIKEEKDSIIGYGKNITFLIAGVVLVAAITYLNPTGGQESSINLLQMNFGTGVYTFFVAMIAISAMVLPGISGSTLLLIFGLYVPIINAGKDVLLFQFEALPAVIVFSLGILAGIASVVRFVKIALERFRSQTIYAIIGLMIGSLYAIVMGPTTLDVPQQAMSISTFSVIFFLIGGMMILGLQLLKGIQK